VTDAELIAPLADDCEALRRDLLQQELPAVWSLDAQTARRLHREGADAVLTAWQPPLAALPVTFLDEPARAGRPAVRVYRRDTAADAEPPVVVVWLHGGGWVLGDLATGHGAAMTACALTGWDVASVDYRCAPIDRFPAAIDDALAGVRSYLDAGRRVVVAGDSAGGNLAAVAARILAGHPGLVGQVLVYPATDPALSFESARSFTEGPFLTRRDMEWFYDQYLSTDADRTDPRVDLMSSLPKGTEPPAVVFTVGHDPLRDEGIAYGRLLAGSGVAVTMIHAPELFHGCITQSGLLPSSAVRVGEMWSAAHALLA